MPKESTKMGYDWWTVGAQKGIEQPPYVVRWKNRWWRTKPVSCAPEGSPENMSPLVKSALDAMGRLPFGVRPCLDYLERTRKRFSDLPLFDDEQAEDVIAKEHP